jgi:hypothetical protein
VLGDQWNPVARPDLDGALQTGSSRQRAIAGTIDRLRTLIGSVQVGISGSQADPIDAPLNVNFGSLSASMTEVLNPDFSPPLLRLICVQLDLRKDRKPVYTAVTCTMPGVRQPRHKPS